MMSLGNRVALAWDSVGRRGHAGSTQGNDVNNVLIVCIIPVMSVSIMATSSTTSTMSYEDSLSSQYLTSSISSLSSARSQSSWIARTYRQAAQLFLTRRLYEALTTIEPVISLASQDGGLGQDGEQEQQEQVDGRSFAPIATASRTTRVKVWSFYLTLLNSIIELGPEEGKLVFGSTKWRGLAAKAREGSVWDEVVRVGYAEDEGAVDGEVVVNL